MSSRDPAPKRLTSLSTMVLNRNPAAAIPPRNPTWVLFPAAVIWAITSCTFHPAHSDDTSHCSGVRVPRVSAKAARSAWIIGQTSAMVLLLSPRCAGGAFVGPSPQEPSLHLVGGQRRGPTVLLAGLGVPAQATQEVGAGSHKGVIVGPGRRLRGLGQPVDRDQGGFRTLGQAERDRPVELDDRRGHHRPELVVVLEDDRPIRRLPRVGASGRANTRPPPGRRPRSAAGHPAG